MKYDYLIPVSSINLEEALKDTYTFLKTKSSFKYRLNLNKEDYAFLTKKVIEAILKKRHDCDCEYCDREDEEYTEYFSDEKELNEYCKENDLWNEEDLKKEGGYGVLSIQEKYVAMAIKQIHDETPLGF